MILHKYFFVSSAISRKFYPTLVGIGTGTSACSFSTTKPAALFDLFKGKARTPKDFGKYSIVAPGSVSAKRSVPDHILKPPYAESMQPPPPPKEIQLHDDDSIARADVACKLARRVLNWIGTKLKVGMTTDEIDRLVHEKIIANEAYPSPLNYMGFPKSVCTSINNVACHGIPDDRQLEDGDIINVDITVYFNGYHGDCSETFLIGNVDNQGRELVEVTRKCLYEAIKGCKNYETFTNIGRIVETVAKSHGYDVVPAFAGHGIGTYFHGPPDIYHCQNSFSGFMRTGMIFTIEPIITQGTREVVILEDGWTAVTLDHARTAQFEETILINPQDATILTEVDD
ncbi:methionine aminopeptidase 1D, mitochondrial [Neocloeon triangulifer]|uniref:methionine aminopeptidase 1D, mitochondrial n=1 Tax=Neocloeon triangulifer TaxID=2078957 RepID=UPI00286F0C42|nr:methionine aminopeptidase 1D, mitochondrial [Neocloeon triangulifer]